jgi:hypothetical protein
MTAPVEVGLVAIGYLGAVLVASAIVASHIASTRGPDRAATGATLFFLRPYRLVWRALSVAALAIAATGLAAFIDYLAPQTAEAGSVLRAWSAFAPLRILVAPLFALAFFLFGLFAPSPSSRVALFAATVIEAVLLAYVAFIWFHPLVSSISTALMGTRCNGLRVVRARGGCRD